MASGHVCRVHHCNHGTVHLTLGDLTLRVTATQLDDLAATLGRAAESLGCAQTRRPDERMLC